MGERERRIAENEAIFRAANERIEAISESFAEVVEEMTIVCECGNVDCIERVTLTTDRYEALRSDPRQFVVLPMHVYTDVETVLSRAGSYWIVRKDSGEAGEIAEQLDPRSG
jgi:hypothetical protein